MAASNPGETSMAKGQIKGNKEAKKPKSDKNLTKSGGSAYKQSQGATSKAFLPPIKK
jgi:hypothetical protein